MSPDIAFQWAATGFVAVAVVVLMLVAVLLWRILKHY